LAGLIIFIQKVNFMKLRNIVFVLLLAGAGYAVYKMMQKTKKTKIIKDRGFEFEVEEDEDGVTE
jgi:hypothetical protein